MFSLIEMSDFLRTLITIMGLISFVLLWLWAYSSKVKKDFEEAEMAPFLDDEVHENSMKKED